jgi:hypothetical protein
MLFVRTENSHVQWLEFPRCVRGEFERNNIIPTAKLKKVVSAVAVAVAIEDE